MLYKVWFRKKQRTPFLIASGLFKKLFLVYSYVFFNAKNRKIAFISKTNKQKNCKSVIKLFSYNHNFYKHIQARI